MCETAKAVIQHWCGLGVESRARVLEPQALLVLPVLQPHLCSQRREFREGMRGPLRRPWDAGASRAHLQKLSDPDSQGLVSIPHCGTSIPHCRTSIPTAGSPSSTAGSPAPLRGLHPHCGVSIPHCGVSIPTSGPPSPTVGSLSPLWGLHPHCGVSISTVGSPFPFWGLHPPFQGPHPCPQGSPRPGIPQ